MTAGRAEVLGLLREIKQRPDEDALRLILADWLEDHGDGHDRARAELIRTQVRGGDELPLRGLITAHRAAWLGPLAPWFKAPTFRRGLMSVQLGYKDFESSALRALADSEAWAWVDGVAVESRFPRRVATNPLLAALNSFACTSADYTAEYPQDLPQAAWLRTVTRLDLSGLGLGFPVEVFTSPHASAVRDLTLSRSYLKNHVLSLIGRLRLKRLTAARSAIEDRDAAAIADEPDFASLEELDLRDNRIGDDGARALAASPHLARLRLLTLFGNPIGTEAAGRLRQRFGSRVLVAGG